MTKAELLKEFQEAALLQLENAERCLREGRIEQSNAWQQRAQVLGWAKARLERLDSLE